VIDLGLDHHVERGDLITLFPDWSDERFPLYVYYPSRNHVPAKVRTFIDFIVGSLGQEGAKAPTHKPRTSVAA
jgi:DNA-binding transcriptional LysR family regulator